MKAFPVTIQHQTSGRLEEGMDLRDYFAAKAMQQFLNFYEGEITSCVAKDAYQIADLMMQARSK
jgi:hypothetical protein